jgi:tetratricopeptide (TPR) repeat protein
VELKNYRNFLYICRYSFEGDRAAAMSELPNFDSWWDYNQPAATEQRFRALEPQAAASGDAGYHAELLTQIARAEGLQRNFAAAHATLDAALELIGPEQPRARIRYLLERGRAFNSAQQPDRARPLFLEAWELGRARHEDFYAVDAAHMLGIVAAPREKLAWEQRALELAEASDQPRARTWLGSLYNNMGWSHHDLAEHAQALDLFKKALAEREAAGDSGAIRIARWCVARALRSLGRYDKALAAQCALAGELAQAGAGDGYVDEELGECLLALGRPDEARPYFARAFAELSQDTWLAAAEPARIERLRALGTAD